MYNCGMRFLPVPSVACVWIYHVNNIVPVPAIACVDMTSSRKVGPFCHATC